MKKMLTNSVVDRLIREEEGADATEYALLAALVAIALIAGATVMGNSLNSILNGIGNRMETLTTQSAL